MIEKVKLIASRIKELRNIAGISAESFANELNIDSKLFHEYESGTVDIPVGFLYEVANKFNMELSALLMGDQPKLHVYSIVRKGKGLNVERRKQYKYEHLAYNFIHKKAEPFIVTAEPMPNDKELEFNSHIGQEFNYVLEGSIMIVVDKHELILNEGDAIYFNSGYQHAMKALNNQSAKFLAIII